MSSGSFKKVTYKLFLNKSYIFNTSRNTHRWLGSERALKNCTRMLLLRYHWRFWSGISVSSYYQALAKIYKSNILFSILVYPNKNIVNNHVDYKSIFILVTQRKGMPVLCKIGDSFKPIIIMVASKFFILYLSILVYRLKQPSHRMQLLHVIRK